MNRTALLGTALAALLAPAIASAQPAPPGYLNDETHLSGRVISSKPWNLQLEVGPHIYLHPGTVIKPTGTTLTHGMWVRVYGHRTADNNFAADEVVLIPGPPPAWRRFENNR